METEIGSEGIYWHHCRSCGVGQEGGVDPRLCFPCDKVTQVDFIPRSFLGKYGSPHYDIDHEEFGILIKRLGSLLDSRNMAIQEYLNANCHEEVDGER